MMTCDGKKVLFNLNTRKYKAGPNSQQDLLLFPLDKETSIPWPTQPRESVSLCLPSLLYLAFGL